MRRRVGARGLKRLGEMYADYSVEDRAGDKVRYVGAALMDETNQEEYILVRKGTQRGPMGLMPGTGAHLVPMDICTVDDNRETVRISIDKDTVNDAPSVDASTTLSPEQVSQIRRYYEVRGYYRL